MVDGALRELLVYGVQKGLIVSEDLVYTANRLLELFHLESAGAVEAFLDEVADGAEIAEMPRRELPQILEELLAYAYEKGLMEDNTVTYKDLFDTKIMGLLTPPPSQVIARFRDTYEQDPVQATDDYYRFSQDTNYIRKDRVSKDMRWKADTDYGALDITINLSKPEKDPKAIAAAGKAKSVAYPKCQLCRENEGYAGRLNHPARQNHRIIPITINNEQWGFQYSPYVYYNEHCIVFNGKHTPMKICRETFIKLFDFVKQFPHYFLGSNADLPIVGGSILSHDHFQGGHYTFAMAKASIEKEFLIPGYEDVQTGIVKWPMSVIRIRHKDEQRLIDLATHILGAWRDYTDEEAFIFAETDGTPHNTITPIARKVGDTYELDLVLRNNITTEEHPLGVYHPHAELHHIKKENIGLIEVMGLAVLPSRLKNEMQALAEAILSGADLRQDEVLSKHADWVKEFLPKYDTVNADNINGILQYEIGIVFMKVLEHAGVYKRDAQGQKAFARFMDTL
jgi:UDPglucose--hexose-1-phosphate uridylyltransferase